MEMLEHDEGRPDYFKWQALLTVLATIESGKIIRLLAEGMTVTERVRNIASDFVAASISASTNRESDRILAHAIESLAMAVPSDELARYLALADELESDLTGAAGLAAAVFHALDQWSKASPGYATQPPLSDAHRTELLSILDWRAGALARVPAPQMRPASTSSSWPIWQDIVEGAIDQRAMRDLSNLVAALPREDITRLVDWLRGRLADAGIPPDLLVDLPTSGGT